MNKKEVFIHSIDLFIPLIPVNEKDLSIEKSEYILQIVLSLNSFGVYKVLLLSLSDIVFMTDLLKAKKVKFWL